MKSSSVAFGSIFSLLLAGCVVGPDAKHPPVQTPASWKGKPAGAATAGLATNWWTLFGDKTLNDLEVRALNANQNLRKAIARVDETRATLRVAKAARYPSLDFGPSYQRSRESAHGSQASDSEAFPVEQNRFRATLESGYEFDLWGRVKRSVESSRAQAESVEAARETVRLNLTADVAQNYFNLRALDAEMEVLRRTLTLRQNTLTVNKSRLEKGVGLPADVSRAEAELANVQSDLSDVRRRRALYENALALLCGEAASAFAASLKADALSTPPKIPVGLPSDLLLRRPDVAEAERTAASKCAEIGVAKAAFLPTVILTGSAGLESIELKELFTWGSRLWSFGPSVTLPVFSGGKNQANLKATEARYEQAVAAYRQSVLGAFRDVEDALADTREYREQADALRQVADSARRTAGYCDQRLQGGMIGNLDVVDAHRILLQAERALVQNLGARYAATVQLIKALGGGWGAEGQL
jgi:outer membrane protein, multidrug efflux system